MFQGISMPLSGWHSSKSTSGDIFTFFVPTYKYSFERNNLNPRGIIVVIIKAEFDPGHSVRPFGKLKQHKAQRNPDWEPSRGEVSAPALLTLRKRATGTH
jgi:hypothetical protein